jgi:hypothetical protein
VLILHAELLTDLDKSAETVNIVWILLVNVFIDLKSFIEQVHSSVARGNHKLPFDFTRLDLEGTLKVNYGLLELILLSMMHAEARDHIDLSRVVTERLLIVMHCLEFILFLLI